VAKNDMSKTMQDMMGAFPVDSKAMQDAFRTQAQLGERLSKVYLEAAEKSAEISSNWIKSTLSKMGEVSTVKEDPSDYAKSMTDFASASAELAAEHMSSYGEIAKRAQGESVELMMAAGKDMSADVSAAMQKISSEATSASKKAATANAK
jgi:hypothetical protein